MRRIVVLAEGSLDFHQAKTAIGVIRYGDDTVVAALDSAHAGRDMSTALGDATGFARHVPVVATLTEALAFQPDTLLIGIAPRGGRLPDEWRPTLLAALAAKLNIVSGLHIFLGDDAELAAAAREHGVTIWDVRLPADEVATRLRLGTPHRAGSQVIYLAGTDCNVGKMTAAIEIAREMRRQHLSADFAATGQTGIMISGRGIPADRIISDFIAGATEALVLESASRHDWVLVEGQGALAHPAYSAVTLGLIHGAAPDAQVLCHQANRTHISGYGTPLATLGEIRRMYETAAGWLKPAPVIAASVNTSELDEAQAHAALDAVAAELGVPATDPVRFGAGPIVEALLAWQGARPSGQTGGQ
ncbi:MAG TPA: DUF1611 domain-containing protein [Ktedonobacterales bacterium]